MAKTYLRTLAYLATSNHFTEMDYPDGEPFDAGDEGNSQDKMISIVQADILLLNLLKGMDNRQKIILMYQVLRESGYNLNHADCARTLSITRERYMVLLKDIKKRAAKILQSNFK